MIAVGVFGIVRGDRRLRRDDHSPERDRGRISNLGNVPICWARSQWSRPMTNIMTDITPLVPRQLVPSLAVSLVGGGRFDIAAENPERFTMLVFYRGLHCPICRTQLGDLETKLPDFAKRGVSV